MDKKIIIIISTILSLVFASALILIYTNIDTLMSNTQGESRNINNNIMLSEFEPYNNKIVSGDTVVATINKFKTSNSGVKMSYAVCKSSTALTTSSNWAFYGACNIAYGSSSASSSTAIDTKGLTSGGYLKIRDVSKEYADEYTMYTSDTINHNDSYRAYVAYANQTPMGIVFIKQ